MGNVTKILDSTVTDTGETQSLKNREILGGKGTYIDFEIGAGDTVVLEGKLVSANDFKTVLTVTADALFEVDLPHIFRCRRTVDGGGADSTVHIQTPDITGIV